jgi:hypothetical protein
MNDSPIEPMGDLSAPMPVTSVFPIEKNRSRAHNQIRWAAGLMPAERIDAIEL